MITYFSFQPDHFNNNGDQGNLEVLKSLIGDSFVPAESIESASFVLFGDASTAVMDHYKPELEKLRGSVKARFAAGTPTLLVGRSYEFFASEMGLDCGRIERVSEFRVSTEGILGYRNAENDLPDFFQKGGFLGTNFFGPIFAKNPQLTQEICRILGAKVEFGAKRMSFVEEIRRRSIGG
jgi:hypothetical protein